MTLKLPMEKYTSLMALRCLNIMGPLLVWVILMFRTRKNLCLNYQEYTACPQPSVIFDLLGRLMTIVGI